MTDLLGIPAFLRRKPVPRRGGAVTFERRILAPSECRGDSHWLKPKGMSRDDWDRLQQAKAKQSVGKLRASEARKSDRHSGKLPADFKTRPYRWDVRTSTWVPDGDAPTHRSSGLIERGEMLEKLVRATAPAKPAPDDLPLQIKERFGLDAAKLKAFALANGCWDDKYAAMPNVGLQRMNVVNRLRAKVRKGHKVKWP